VPTVLSQTPSTFRSAKANAITAPVVPLGNIAVARDIVDRIGRSKLVEPPETARSPEMLYEELPRRVGRMLRSPAPEIREKTSACIGSVRRAIVCGCESAWALGADRRAKRLIQVEIERRHDGADLHC
jgi:hypothetical protein